MDTGGPVAYNVNVVSGVNYTTPCIHDPIRKSQQGLTLLLRLENTGLGLVRNLYSMVFSLPWNPHHRGSMDPSIRRHLKVVGSEVSSYPSPSTSLPLLIGSGFPLKSVRWCCGWCGCRFVHTKCTFYI